MRAPGDRFAFNGRGCIEGTNGAAAEVVWSVTRMGRNRRRNPPQEWVEVPEACGSEPGRRCAHGAFPGKPCIRRGSQSAALRHWECRGSARSKWCEPRKRKRKDADGRPTVVPRPRSPSIPRNPRAGRLHAHTSHVVSHVPSEGAKPKLRRSHAVGKETISLSGNCARDRFRPDRRLLAERRHG